MRALNGWLIAVYGFLYLPIAVLMVLSFNRSGMPTAWGGFSLEWYGKLAQNPKIIGAAWNSLVVAIWATAISTVLGTLLALGVERARRSAAREALLFAPMIIPDIVLAIALLSFFTLIKFTLGLRSIVMAHVVFNLAFVCAVVRARLKSYDWSLNEASRDLGASAAATFFRITLPLIGPSVLAGGLLAFTLSIDEFIIAYFTAGAGQSSTTLPMQIYAMIRFGVTPEINAMATVVMGLSFVMILAAQRLNRGRLPGT
ncbi:MAG: ABC transporter permease [Aestuariivirga sp.]|uniref:ABC transporter permease n=1 Tax=Aestuariivirga sp. TaxID=2650926 RepID=UPI0025C644E5|nr:ABC transporter permease [Aestuariivirga sp.]MCA3560540.1 ABC transporter permease [Aestuariivirga sp.]